MQIESSRLILRPILKEDWKFFLRLVNQDSWKATIGDRNLTSQAAAETYLETTSVQHHIDFGYGYYVISEKTHLQPIGTVGLVNRSGLIYPDLGFALLDEFSGNGYATEASLSLIAGLKTSFKLTVLEALVLPKNQQSKNVLQKCGFQLLGSILLPNETEPLEHYRLELV